MSEEEKEKERMNKALMTLTPIERKDRLDSFVLLKTAITEDNHKTASLVIKLIKHRINDLSGAQYRCSTHYDELENEDGDEIDEEGNLLDVDERMPLDEEDWSICDLYIDYATDYDPDMKELVIKHLNKVCYKDSA